MAPTRRMRRANMYNTNRTRRRVRGGLEDSNLTDASIEGLRIDASQRALTRQQQIASAVLDKAVDRTAHEIRMRSKALAKIAKDPEAMKEFAETIQAVGFATAKVAENSGIIAGDWVELFSPAVKEWVFASSDLIQDILFDATMGILGSIPVLGDIAATGMQILDSVNENFWRSYWAGWRAFPRAVNVAGDSVNMIGEAAEDYGKVGKPMNKLANRISQLTKLEEEKMAEEEKKGQTRRRKNRQEGGGKYRRKKGTKKKGTT